MLCFSFKRGLRFVEQSREWTLVRGDYRGRYRFEADTGAATLLYPAEVLDRYVNREWVIDESSIVGRKNIFFLASNRDLASYEERQQRKPRFIKKCVDFILGKNVSQTRKEFEKSIPDLKKAVGDEFPLTASSLLRWMAIWNKHKDLAKFVDRRLENPGRRPREWSLTLLERAIKNITSPVHTPGAIYEELKQVRDEHNRDNPEDQVEIMSRSAFFRHAAELIAQLEGRPAASSPRRTSRRRTAVGVVTTTHVLERVELDFHKIDLVPVSTETGKRVERAWIVVAIDHFSRMVLGYHVTIGPPNAKSVVQCLKHAILPKTSTLSRYPNLVSPWPAAGIIELVTTDNGTEMWAESVEQACAQLLIPFRYCPGEMPEMKAYIERFWKTLSMRCIKTASGTTFSNITERGDYDSNAHAVYDIVLLSERIAKWIVDGYHRKKHRGIKTSPLRKWEASPRLDEIEHPADPQYFDILICDQVRRTVQHYGIEDDHIIYNNDHLMDMLKRLGGPTEVLVKRPDDDVNHIYVLNPQTNLYFKIEARKGGYKLPMPRFLHKIIVKEEASQPHAAEDEAVSAKTTRILNNMNTVAKEQQKRRLRAAVDRTQQPSSADIIAGNGSAFSRARENIKDASPQPIDVLDSGLDDDIPELTRFRYYLGVHDERRR